MKITNAKCSYIPEKLKAPFGFKGGYLSELWQVVCHLECGDVSATGVGVQSVLWSDSELFSTNTEEQGNRYMLDVTEFAVKQLCFAEGDTPIDIIDKIYPSVLEYAKQHTNVGEKLRETFVRNALVSVDNALWQLYARLLGKSEFYSVIPKKYLAPLANKHQKLCNIPLISYGVSIADINDLLLNGAVVLKIKIGFDNGGKMSKEEMLSWDKNRLSEVHSIAKEFKTPYTKSGNILYYLDANGKYDTVERVNDLLSFAEAEGALDRIILLEEPFEEDNRVDVSSLPVRVAADESVHSLKDVSERISLGYKAIALKPIAKTLSETLKILLEAHKKEIVCFCADLTVNPLLVEWNKNVAAHIKTLPELKIGVLESNGEQNYTSWDRLNTYHPCCGLDFVNNQSGIYNLNDDFYKISGGIFLPSQYYDNV